MNLINNKTLERYYNDLKLGGNTCFLKYNCHVYSLNKYNVERNYAHNNLK